MQPNSWFDVIVAVSINSFVMMMTGVFTCMRHDVAGYDIDNKILVEFSGSNQVVRVHVFCGRGFRLRGRGLYSWSFSKPTTYPAFKLKMVI